MVVFSSKVISKRFCKTCKKSTVQGLITSTKKAQVLQCLTCKTVRTEGTNARTGF